jgi:hypothetical protein
MSEYQYYEFRTVDRGLTEVERKELRALSSRAEITASSFVNSYNFGDFRGDPAKLMERYFDLFLYFANWGSRRFSMRLPTRLIDPAQLKKFFIERDMATERIRGDKLIIDVFRDEIEHEDWEDDGSGSLADLAPLRADVLNGDRRVFYLIWLMAVEFGEEHDNAVEPLGGIAPLTPALEAFAGFFDIDPDLVAAAASTDPAAAVSEPSRQEVTKFLRSLGEDEKVSLLLRQYDGNDPHLAVELRGRYRASLAPSTETPAKRRTVAQLREIAGRLAEERRQAAEKREAAERRRRERKLAEEKRLRIAALATRGEAVWRELEGMIELRNSKGYQQAAALLADLRDLARERGQSDDFEQRLADIRARHATKRRFLERLEATDGE